MTELTPSKSSLYPIVECPELMADACLCDEQRNLVFLSTWGRDTAAQEFLARLTLAPEHGGLDQFHLAVDETVKVPVFVSNADRLAKRSTRAFRRTLFGSLVHVWVFDKRCVSPDKTNASALAILPKRAPNLTDRLWVLVRDTCPLPLLDHWRDSVMDLLRTEGMLTPLSFSFGPVEGYRLTIDVPAVTATLGGLIRAGALATSPDGLRSSAPLKRVA